MGCRGSDSSNLGRGSRRKQVNPWEDGHWWRSEKRKEDDEDEEKEKMGNGRKKRGKNGIWESGGEREERKRQKKWR